MLLSAAASQIFSQPETYLYAVSPHIEQAIVQYDEGQYGTTDSDVAYVHLPNTATLNENSLRSWKLASLLDPLLLNVLQADNNAVAAYITTKENLTRLHGRNQIDIPPDLLISEYFLYTDVAPANNPERETR
ncbi:MAG: hypothetical protein AB8G18_01125 [Gammaproteobacteria bacterium]